MTNREWIKVAPADLRQGDETPDYVVSGHMRQVKDHTEQGERLMMDVNRRDGGRALARLDRLPDALRADALERLAASLNDRARAARCDLEAPQA